MTNKNAVSKIFSSSLKIYLCSTNNKISELLKDNLFSQKNFSQVGESDDMDLVLQVSGFNLPSWADSVDLTTTLQKMLNLARANHAKYILVVPDKADDFIKVAVSLVEQFSRLHKINFQILWVENYLSEKEISETILKKIFRLSFSIAPSVKSVSQIQKTSEKRHKRELKPWELMLFGMLGYLMVIWLVFGLSFSLALITLQPWLAKTAYVTSMVAPGANYAAANWVVSPETVVDLANLSNVEDRLSQGLLEKLTDESGVKNLISQKQDLSQLVDTSNYLLSAWQGIDTSQNWLKNLQKKYIDQSQAVRQTSSKINNLLGDLEFLYGLKQPTKYLILLQDNTEIRPTGGFLQGFITLDMQNGGATNINFYDTAQTDMMLRGQIDPPADLAANLHQFNWYLRDANWDPNFVNSSSRMAWFVNKELSQTPDVVVGVNWQTLAAGLKAFGPINLPDFGGEITAENWLVKYQQNVKADPNAPKFMLAVAKAVMDKWPTVSKTQKTDFIKSMFLMLDNRQVLVAPTGTKLNGLAMAGWTGEQYLPACRSQYPCQSLYLQPVEANIGLNKINPFIDRSQNLDISIQDNKISYSYTINYANKSPSRGWPVGDYKNYLRIYLPKGVVVGDVSWGGQVLTTNDYRVDFDGNYVVVKLAGNVTFQEQKSLNVKFAQLTPGGDRFHYQLDWLNQAGLKPENIQISFKYPANWLVSAQKQYDVAGSGFLKYNRLLSAPERLDLDFVKWKN